MSLGRWFQTPRRLPLLFVAVMLIPAVALGWLTLQLLERDRRLEAQQAQERAEHTADAIVAASHQRLAELEGRLRRLVTGEEGAPPADTVLVVAEGDRITVTPAGALVYYPVLPAIPSQPRDAYAEGERYEHQQADVHRAIDWFGARARTADPAPRAGALLRLGRNQRRAGQTDAALATYAELAKLGATPVDGFPAALLALSARCGILETLGRRDELAVDARALRAGLARGTWPLLRDVYDYYLQEARRWTRERDETEQDRDARAIAASFLATYEQWTLQQSTPAREFRIAEGRPIMLAATASPKGVTALLAAAKFVEGAWENKTAVQVLLSDGQGRPIFGAAAGGSAPRAVRTTDASKMPWTLRVTSTTQEADRTETTRRRGLLLAGLATVLVLLAGSAYFTLRGVTRELAVARLQSDFVAAVSHEFRTPLASVRHLSDMLSKGRVADEAERQQCYHFLSRESERLERLVEDLLDFGRIEGGAYRYRFEQLDAAALVRGLVKEFQENAGPKGYRVDLSVNVEPVVVSADREALSRAVWNLLDNAVKYSPGADTVWVDLAIEGDSVVIRVRDRGLGIAVSEQHEIFRKFVRGSNAHTEQIKGTGIGLAMVHHIVEAHHGDVRVESQPSQGSTFALRLPLERPA